MIAEHDLDPTEPIRDRGRSVLENDEHSLRNHIIDLIVNVSFRSLKINNFYDSKDLRLNQL